MPRATPARLERIAWTYVSGLVAALDTRLLSHRATLELLNSDRFQELAARVRQTIMFTDLPESTEPFVLAEAMQASYAAAIRRMRDASPSGSVAQLFLLPIEWQAFRGLLREKALGLERAAAPGSATPEAIWDQCWAGQQTEAAFEPFARAAAALRDAAPADQRTPQLLDAITQLAEARHLRRAADEVGSPDIAAWTRAWLNLRLAVNLLRCRLGQWAGALSPEALDDLGEAKRAAVALLAEERRDWRPLLASLGLQAAQGISDDEALPAAAAERLADDAMTELVRTGHSVAFGPEPLFTFLWGLRIEALNLKAIVAGTAAGLPRDTIARDIRQTYG